MLYGVFQESEQVFGGIYYTYDEVFRDTFSPDTEQLAFFDLKAHGKTYAEKKESVRNNAIAYSNTCGEIDLSYHELAILSNYFAKYGKRYGLLQEFKENGIC